MKLQFQQTCGACPESYEIFKDGEYMGYIRARYGTARYTESGEEDPCITLDLVGDGTMTVVERNVMFNKIRMRLGSMTVPDNEMDHREQAIID